LQYSGSNGSCGFFEFTAELVVAILKKTVQVGNGQRSKFGNGLAAIGYIQCLRAKPGSLTVGTVSSTRKAQYVLVPVPNQDLFHDGNDATIEAFLPGPGSDATPLHAGFKGVFAEGDFYSLAAIKDDFLLFIGHILPGYVHMEVMGLANIIQHIHGYL